MTTARRVAAGAMIAATTFAVAQGVARDSIHAGIGLTFVLVTVDFLVVGLLILERRPGNAVGPVMVAFGIVIAVFCILDAWVRLPESPSGAAAAAFIVSLIDAPTFILIALLFLLFPDGHLPSMRWRWLVGATLALGVAVFLGALLRPGPLPYYTWVDNPLGPPANPVSEAWELTYSGLVGCVAIAALSLAVRWRRADLAERAQLKWAAGAAVLVAVAMITYGLSSGPSQFSDLGDLTVGIALGLFPIAIGIAILRYRLYEVDRIISRTLGWAIVTGLLVAVFAGSVLALQSLLAGFTQGQTLAVAASTLAASALFQPVRRRVQRAVDRRFDRARYDAERTALAFAERLRDVTDISTVTGDLGTTTAAALAPTGLGVWLRDGRG